MDYKTAALQLGGSLASAWGQYQTDKKRNKLIENDMAYKKALDARAIEKENKAQANLDDAFSISDFNIKKKKEEV